MRDGYVPGIEASVRQLLERRTRIVLAVSGGLDSSVLLDAVGKLRTDRHRITVASVDHGTGPEATESTAQAVAAAARFGLPVVTERFALAGASEASWRDARWRFLRTVARQESAVVVTAHTLDDHLETVMMRILRGASARGLAGLLAEGDIERPLQRHSRREIQAWASSHRIRYVDDPSNASRAYLRNRVRLDLSPAIASVRPEFGTDLLRLSERAAELRRQVDSLAGRFLAPAPPGCVMAIDAVALGTLGTDGVRLILPSLLARAAIALDRRGIERLVNLIPAARGARGQLSGGIEAVRGREEILIRKPSVTATGSVRLRVPGETEFAGFRFHVEPSTTIGSGAASKPDVWRIHFPLSAQLVVRQWHPGDRLRNDLTGGRRKVKRYFADAGVVGPLRSGWPVVARGEDVIWIPGVRSPGYKSQAEEPMIEIRCERVRG